MMLPDTSSLGAVAAAHYSWRGDTNLLIDYFAYGSLLWQGESLPENVSDEYGVELEGLQLILGLWVFRDIRFIILPDTINDTKKQLSPERRLSRMNAFQKFASALRLAEYGELKADRPSREGLLILPDVELDRAVKEVPGGYDRTLVRDAVRSGAHVF